MPATSLRDARQGDEAIRATIMRFRRPDGHAGAAIERQPLAATQRAGLPAGAGR